MRIIRLGVAAAVMAAALALGCGRAGAPGGRAAGTVRMADTLAAIYARALLDPQRQPFLNRLRADTLRAVAAQAFGPDALQLRYLAAQERLLAGQSREAIGEIETLMELAGVDREGITPRTRELYDLLAIAWLRLGEQENCLDNPAGEVCILPFRGEARHAREEGARRAAGLYGRILDVFPDDDGSRWLLNVAAMALGGYPDSLPRQRVVPGLAAPPGSGFPFYENVAPRLGVAVDGLAGGLAIADFNGDGRLDLFMTSWGPTDPVHLYLADASGGYVNATAEAGLDGITGGLNVVHADYDNDGREDLFILRGAWLGDAGTWPNSLLRNLGNGRFEDVTFAAGVASFHPTHSAAWADYDLDGRLDLFVGNESSRWMGGNSHRSELYRNNGDGTFTEVSAQVGMDVDAFVKGMVWGDVNDDGLPDLYLSVLGAPNLLYLNRGATAEGGWRFEEAAVAAGVGAPTYSFPTWFWDVDQDGHEDLLVLSYDLRFGTAVHTLAAREYLGKPAVLPLNGVPTPVERSRLYRNRGDGTFEDVTRAWGLEDRVIYAMGSNWGDLDNDGWPDAYVGTGNPDLRSIVPNRMFRNVAGTRFEEVTIPGGFGHIQKAHGTAFADLDGDGDEDIYMVMGGAYQGDRFANVLYENPGWPGRHWVTLELEGRAANRSAIGARVAVTVREGTATRTVYRTVSTGGSFGAGPLAVHVGLGAADSIEQVRIRWPDAARSEETHRGLAMDRTWRVVQGTAPVAIDRPAMPFRKGAPRHEGH